MATYKVIQDIEADDKLIGPLTLRQSVYGFITGCLLFMTYFVIAKGAAFMAIFFLPPAAIGAFFAFPWSHEQSTEVWALARIRFMFKPRRRIWDQSGIKELVTITVPKRMEQIYTDGLSQTEVRSRLNALASTLDSRGWATKSAPSSYAYSFAQGDSDRLLAVDAIPQEVSPFGSEVYADMLDPADNHVAEQFDTMLNIQARTHHQQLINSFEQPQATVPPAPLAANTPAALAGQTSPAAPADFWFLNDQSSSSSPMAPLVVPGQAPTQLIVPEPVSPEEEQALVETLKQHEIGKAYEYSHLPKILPLAEREKLEKQEAEARAKELAAQAEKDLKNTSAMTEKPGAAILEFAGNNDLSVEAIARQAKKAQQQSDDEVVISLH